MARPQGIAGLINSIASGCTVVKTYCWSEEASCQFVRWTLHPSGFTVEAKHVSRLFELGCLEGVGDGLFPGETRQYRWRLGAEVALADKLRKTTIEKLLPELRPAQVAA